MTCTCIRNEVGWIVIPDRNCTEIAARDPWMRDIPPSAVTQNDQYQDDDGDDDQDGPQHGQHLTK